MSTNLNSGMLADMLMLTSTQLMKAEEAFDLHELLQYDVSRQVIDARFKRGGVEVVRENLLMSIGEALANADNACSRAMEHIRQS